MKYIEYVYLAVAIGLIVFMVTNSKHLTTLNYIAIFVGILISSFMFSFRRQQRIAFEKAEAEELNRLREEAGEDGD